MTKGICLKSNLSHGRRLWVLIPKTILFESPTIFTSAFYFPKFLRFDLWWWSLCSKKVCIVRSMPSCKWNCKTFMFKCKMGQWFLLVKFSFPNFLRFDLWWSLYSNKVYRVHSTSSCEWNSKTFLFKMVSVCAHTRVNPSIRFPLAHNIRWPNKLNDGIYCLQTLASSRVYNSL